LKNMKRDLLVIGITLVAILGGYFVIVYPGKSNPFEPAANPHGDSPHMGEDFDMESALSNLDGLPEGFDQLVLEGNRYMDNGNYPVGAECYRRALEIRDAPDVRVDFGACLHAMGLEDRAEEEFRTVLGQVPDHPIATFNMGIVFYTGTTMDSARVYFERYLELDPNGLAATSATNLLKEINDGI